MLADEKIIDRLTTLIEFLDNLKIEYLIFGSCGIQSYLPRFFRLPNDIDIVIREADCKTFIDACTLANYKTVNELGRYKIFIKKFPIHVIPEVFSIVNDDKSGIWQKVNLTEAFKMPVYNQFNLSYSSVILSANVMPLDFMLVLELARKQDTNTFYNLINILSINGLQINKVNEILEENSFLKPKVQNTIMLLKSRLELHMQINEQLVLENLKIIDF